MTHIRTIRIHMPFHVTPKKAFRPGMFLISSFIFLPLCFWLVELPFFSLWGWDHLNCPLSSPELDPIACTARIPTRYFDLGAFQFSPFPFWFAFYLISSSSSSSSSFSPQPFLLPYTLFFYKKKNRASASGVPPLHSGCVFPLYSKSLGLIAPF